MRVIKSVAVGLSGGVDSAVSAYLLKREGYHVIGVTLRTWEPDEVADAEDSIFSDAEKIAETLDIPFYVVDCRPAFAEHVSGPFTEAYIKGLTPNPCISCNRYIKWERMLAFADETGADLIATGHYACIEKLDNNRLTVRQTSASGKDQTYMLYQLTQEQLARTLMPLAGMEKEEVRKIAAEAGLPVAGKKDSQEICFVPDRDYAGYIRSHSDGELPPPGHFVDQDGNILGTHKGIVHYTVGQRKGLGLALGHPAYVSRIDAASNNVVIGGLDAVLLKEIYCRDLCFMAIEDLPEGSSIRAGVRIRYHHRAVPASIEKADDGIARIRFDEAVKAPAPGQSAVFYDDLNRVIGGGIITADSIPGGK